MGLLLYMLCACLIYYSISQTTGSLLLEEGCGDTQGCFYDCSDTDCDFTIYWKHNPDLGTVEFSFNKKIPNIYEEEWLAMGLSYDREMGSDSVLECTVHSSFFRQAEVRHSYNDQHYNLPVYFGATNGIHNVTGQVVDGVLTCNFTRTIIVKYYDEIYNLDTSWYLLAAYGYMELDSKKQHTNEPSISPYKVDLREHRDVNGKRVYYLVKLHGCLMVFSWMMIASVAVILSRYFKQAWPHDKLCGRPPWYQTHRLLMITAVLCVIAAFVIIWYDTGRYSQLIGASTFQRSHPVLGVIIMGLTLLNPIMAFLKPSSGTASRPVFKYAHGFIGTTLYLLALLNIALGTTLKKSDTHSHTLWVIVGFAVYQFLIEVILQTHNCYLIKSGQKAAYEMKQITPVEESISSLNQEPPGMVFKKSLLAFHVVVVFGVGTTCIFLVAM